MDVEEAGAADDVLLQGVVHTLVLLLQHAGHGTRVTTCTLVLLLVQGITTQGITVPVRGAHKTRGLDYLSHYVPVAWNYLGRWMVHIL